MNVAVKPEKVNIDAPLAGKLSLVTGLHHQCRLAGRWWLDRP